MRRFILGFALLILLGCQSAGDSGGEAPLTPKERAAWGKYRQGRETRPEYRIAVYKLSEKAWSLYSPDGGWKPNLDGPGINDLEEAQTTAKRVAGRPNIKAVALLEMLEEEEPEIVEWESDDGRGAQSSESAPSPELDRSLKVFLLQLQRSVTSRP